MYDWFGKIPEGEGYSAMDKCTALGKLRPVRWDPYESDKKTPGACRKIPMDEIIGMQKCTSEQVYDTVEKKCIDKSEIAEDTDSVVREAVSAEQEAVAAEAVTAEAEKIRDEAQEALEADPDDDALKAVLDEAEAEYQTAKDLSDAARQAVDDLTSDDSPETFVNHLGGDSLPKLVAILVVLGILFWKNKKQIRKFFK